jgi:hypothetical protein
MAHKGPGGVLGAHARAVIGYAEEGDPAPLDFSRNGCGTGIRGIFEQLF